VVLDVVHENVHECLVKAFDLATGLRVVRGRVQVPDAHEVAQTGEEQEGELGSVVRQDGVRGTVHVNPIRQNADETSVAVTPARGTDLTRFENRSTVIRRKTFPVLVYVSGPMRSMDRLAKGSVAGKTLGIAVRSLGAILFRANDVQLATPSYTSAAMDAQ